MAKVKKGKGVTKSGYGRDGRRVGTRPKGARADGRASKAGTKRDAARKGTVAKSGKSAAKVRKPAAGARKAPRTGRPARAPEACAKPAPRFSVRALDPLRLCGAGTSVQKLFRVDERIDGRAAAHLVFLDRHGWYCEHGRTCPAVAQARTQSGRMARGS